MVVCVCTPQGWHSSFSERGVPGKKAESRYFTLLLDLGVLREFAVLLAQGGVSALVGHDTSEGNRRGVEHQRHHYHPKAGGFAAWVNLGPSAPSATEQDGPQTAMVFAIGIVH